MNERSPHTVLVAEDDDDMRELLVEALERDGHAVVAARDASAALALLLGDDETWKRPSIVLTDLRMPGVDGLTIAEVLSARVPRIPTILLTAFPSPEVLDRAYKSGVVAVLEKPVDLDVLRTAVLVFADRAA